MQKFPFENEQQLIKHAGDIWYDQCTPDDWLEAFTHHPKIGDVKSLAEKFSSTQHLAGNEQAGVNQATEAIIDELAVANAAYQNRFDFIFIVCATGKSAGEMLRILKDRLVNTKEEELAVAVGEQYKITLLRLKKIIDEGDWTFIKVSQVTSHVLDTSIGKPGQNITIKLKQSVIDGWQTISQGITNADGRLGDLLPPGRNLKPGNYKMVFDTHQYFLSKDIKGFYPEVEIQFTIFDDTHYHVPLLINPFGYF